MYIGNLALGVALIISGYTVPAYADSLPGPVAHRKAVDAFWALERRPWDQSTWSYAMAELQTAAQRSPHDPWVSIGYAKLAMTMGYQSYSANSPESIDAAYRFAKQAVQDGPNESMAHAYLGLVLYNKGGNEASWQSYQKAMQLDPKNPMPVLYVATAMMEVHDYRGLEQWIRRAESLATHPEQRLRLYPLKRALANSRKDAAEVERLFKAEIGEQPENPWAHGNYASFLQHNRRYDEAIREYEKALAILDYPMARAGLEQSKRSRSALQH